MISQVAFLGGAEAYMIGAFAIGYFIGGLPVGLFVARGFGLGDIRRTGSGNIGATNVLRAGSAVAALLTLSLDVLKGFGPTMIALAGYDLAWLTALGLDVGIVGLPERFFGFGANIAAFAGLGCFVGHCYSPYLGLWGGKGVATGFGVFLAWSWPVAAICAGIWIVVAALSRYSSLAALTVAVSSPVLFGVFERWEFLPATLLMTVILFARHRPNIGRLWRGEESRIRLRRSTQ